MEPGATDTGPQHLPPDFLLCGLSKLLSCLNRSLFCFLLCALVLTDAGDKRRRTAIAAAFPKHSQDRRHNTLFNCHYFKYNSVGVLTLIVWACLVGGTQNLLYRSRNIYIDNFNLLFFYVFCYIVTIIEGKVSILFYFLKQIGGNEQNILGQCCPTELSTMTEMLHSDTL